MESDDVQSGKPSRFSVNVLPIRQYLSESSDELGNHGVIMLSSYPEPAIDSEVPFLFLAVDDITNPTRPTAFKPSNAERVTEFLNAMPLVTCLYVCCDGGVSRSAALAASLLFAWYGDDTAIWADPQYHPNSLVYATMRFALGCPCGEEELAEKVALSEKALMRKIGRTAQQR